MSRTVAYHRPDTMEEALSLLASAGETGAARVILAGGTVVNTGAVEQEVVDLQALGLSEISAGNGSVVMGAMTRLQDVFESSAIPQAVRDAAQAEQPSTLRTVATIGGTLASKSHESRLLAALLAFDAEVTVVSATGETTLPLGDYLAADVAGIISSLEIASTGVAASAVTGRTPADVPIVSAVARAVDGGVTVALTGVAATPVLVNPEDPTAGLNPTGDFRGSTEYRLHVAKTLADRVIAEVSA